MEGDLTLIEIDYYEGYEKLLSKYPMKSGQVIKCSITPDKDYEEKIDLIYIDINSSSRLNTENIIFLNTEDDRVQLEEPQESKLYVTLDTKTFYINQYKNWVVVSNINNIKHIFFLNNLTVSTLYKQSNGVSTPYAPRTLASAVYLSSGATVEDLAKNITRISTSIASVTATINEQTSFEVPYPFDNYMTLGNSMMVYIGTTFITNTRYSLSPDYSTIYFLNGMNVKKGRDVTFVFLYNSRPMLNGSAPTSYMTYDGGYMGDATLPIQKMKKYSSSLYNKDIDCVATSKAIADLYETILTKLDNIGSKYSIYAKAFGTSTAYQLDIPNFVLTDFDIIHMRTNVACGDNATLQINNGDPIPIYASFTDRLVAGDIAENEVVTLTYNADENRFYIISDTGTMITSTQFVYLTTEDEEDTFDLSQLDYNPTFDILEVYQDGFMLTKDEHYTVGENNNSVTLLGYTAEQYTEFTFRILTIDKAMPGASSTSLNAQASVTLSNENTPTRMSRSAVRANELFNTGKWDVITDAGGSNNLSFVYNGVIAITMTPNGEIITNKISTRSN